MPRGFGLSEATKDGIWGLRAEGLSDREIGRRLGPPRGSVSNHLLRFPATTLRLPGATSTQVPFRTHRLPRILIERNLLARNPD